MTGLFATVEDPRPQVLVGQGPAPAGATIEHYRAEGLDLVPGAGALAAAVPGSVDAWLLLLRDHGTWELADVLAFAVEYAEEGHQISARAADTVARVADLFRDHWPTSAALWMPEGRPPVAGEVVRPPGVRRDAAATGRVRRRRPRPAGPDRRGPPCLGRGVRRGGGRRVRAGAPPPLRRRRPRRGPHPRRHGGLAGGLRGTGHARRPRRHDLPRRGVGTGPRPAAGACHPGRVRAPRGWPPRPRPGPTGSSRRSSSRSPTGTPTTATPTPTGAGVPLETLLSADYAAERRALIGEQASHEFRPGDLGGAPAYRPPLATEHHGPEAGAAAGEPTVGWPADPRRHLPPRHRRPVGQHRVGHALGRLAAVLPDHPRARLLPRHPAADDLAGRPGAVGPATGPAAPHDADADAAAARRPPVAALGTPGGDQQDQWQLLYLLRVLVGGYSPQQAIDAPALHTTSMVSSFWPRNWTPVGVVAEARLGDDVIAGLEQRGHRVTVAATGRWQALRGDP